MKLYRIFLVIGGKASPVDNSRMWVKNLYDPLIKLGHDVFLLDIDEFAEKRGFGSMSVEGRQHLSNELPGIFKKAHARKPFDIFFSYLQSYQIIPEALKEIKNLVYLINYTTNFHQFDLFSEIGKIVDCNIYISKVAASGFDPLPAKSYWMPFAANPAFYQPALEKNDHVVFIGSVYAPRPYMFWRLLQYGINLHLYGTAWNSMSNSVKRSPKTRLKNVIKSIVYNTTGRKLLSNVSLVKPDLEGLIRENHHELYDNLLSLIQEKYPAHLHPSLNDEDYVKTLAEAATVINLAESRYNHDYIDHRVIFGANLRDFEATMCGSFLCTQYSEEINELFEVGKEVICYHNEHDLAEKINYYNINIEQREQIAKAGRHRTLHNHTWEKRFINFFDFLDVR
jgi:glycosyltransferase involved in cell wall biosynthesis